MAKDKRTNLANKADPRVNFECDGSKIKRSIM